MDRAKKQRRVIRASITKTLTEADLELGKEETDAVILQAKLQKLVKLMEDVSEVDKQIEDLLLDDVAVTDDELEREREAAEDYQERATIMKIRVEQVLEGQAQERRSVSSYETAGHSVEGGKQKTYKLPKLELKTFSGEMTDWLGWWSQFEKIHKDEDLHESDKFQYLVQCMVEGTKAKEIVDSYPHTAENYPKVIATLQQRFGKKGILRQIYVRGLLKMVVSNARGTVKLADVYDKLECHLRALESLEVTMEQMNQLLYPMVESCLPEEVLVAWQRSPHYNKDGSQENPPRTTMDYLLEFLRQEVENESVRSFARSGFQTDKGKGKAEKQERKGKFQSEDDIPTVAGLHIGKSACIFCDKNHPSQECFKAKKMSLEERRSAITSKRACYSCLQLGHNSKKCKIKINCSYCGGRHYTSLCDHLPPKETKPKSQAEATTSTGINSRTQVKNQRQGTVFMEVLLVKVHSVTLRVLFDSGSQQSYIRSDVAERLGVKKVGEKTEYNVTFESKGLTPVNRSVYEVPLMSSDGGARRVLKLASCAKINEHVPRIHNGPWIAELKRRGIVLSDCRAETENVDILIGLDLINQLETGRQVRTENGLVAVEYVFGWTIRGPTAYEEATSSMLVSSLFVSNAPVHQLWDLDVLGIRDQAFQTSKEEKENLVKKHFMETVARDEDGRYSVSLPWVGGKQEIPSNRAVAEKRLMSATKKLNNDGMFEAYDQVFKGWEHEGIVERVDPVELPGQLHYLPHRPVFKPESITTPVRPVFDASCKVGRYPSLNERLEKGPNLVELIPTIMLRFREGRIGVLSDIRKAFLMVNVKEEERNYLRFLWWEDASCQVMREIRHCRVVFGVNCSPFLLAAVIEYHLSQVHDEDKPAAEKFLKSLYVDNSITSFQTLDEYQDFKERSTRILADAKMELRQWEYAMEDEDGSITYYPPNQKMSSVLGMVWDKEKDALGYDPVPELPNLFTKRSVLSMVQKIFDPMGYLSPALLLPKLMIQHAWLEDLDWDSEMPVEMAAQIISWANELKSLNQIWIPRNMSAGFEQKNQWELHMFCDASKNAYAAAVFLLVKDEDDTTVSVQLLQSKARVAPLKRPKNGKDSQITIPRLELLACVIGLRLMGSVRKTMDISVPTHYWSDSTTALAWIKRNDEWGTFVGNRVREICSLSSPNQWRHVPGVHNPADLPSRGCGAQELLESKWWEGPSWMRLPKTEWPTEEVKEDEEVIASERKKTVKTTVSVVSQSLGVFPYNTFQENLNFAAATSRFIEAYRKKKTGQKSLSPGAPYSVDELEAAERRLWMFVQTEVGLKDEATQKKLQFESDENGIIRLRSKLLHKEDTEGFRKPILLPSEHPLVEQLVMDVHLKNSHGGVQFLMSALRENYWILRSRKGIQRVLKKCLNCQRYKAKAPVVIPAPLPDDRVRHAKVFEVMGVDLAGPLYLKGGEKTWIVLFTCAVYRAVHLDFVSSLSTDSFLLAFYRFMAVRGRPSTVYSDNGTNFVGAENLFQQLDWKKIETEMGLRKIRWKFNPPGAPWWGGFWERLIQEVKKLLVRMLGKGRLTHEQLTTALCEAMATINSRPLTYVTEDSEDLIPLTPSMFLQEVRGDLVPEEEALDAAGIRSQYRHLRKLKEELKQRFRSEYLGLLMEKSCQQKPRELSVNDIVIVGVDNKKRYDWPLARILELIKSQDGAVRVARVQTGKGTLIRPIQRLYPMELSCSASVPVEIPESVKERAKKVNAKCREDELTALEEASQDLEVVVVTKSGRASKKPQRFVF